MKTETVVYPADLLNEDKARVETRVYITEEEMLNLVSLLTRTVLEYRTMGIEYEIRMPAEAIRKEAGGEEELAKGEVVIRFDRPKR
jgi:hypothetical protein